jgi:F-type H+-transporting ATP synthase subunit e
LAAGLVYGYVHHNTLTALENNRAEQKKIEHRDHLIAQAKAEWTKMNTPTGGKACSGLFFFGLWSRIYIMRDT